MNEKIVIFGAGGHAKVVIDALESEGKYQIAFIADVDAARIGTTILGYPIRPEEEGFAAVSMGVTTAMIAIGANASRCRLAIQARQLGFTLATVIHPNALVSRTAVVGLGSLVMPGGVINADVRIGENVIINSGAVIEHDCVVGDDVHIAPNATLCGGVHVGRGSLIGAGSTILVGVSIGAEAVIGAGSTVLSSIPAKARAVGSPCRILES